MMNRRLFWKILLIFWIIFIIAFQTTWIAFSVYVENNRENLSFVHIPTKVKMIAQLLHLSGKSEAERFIANLPEDERKYFEIIPVEALEENPFALEEGNNEGATSLYREMAVAPDGETYLVTFVDPESAQQSESLFNMPIPLVLMGILGGLLFSLFLAWNLTRPMKLLRNGFKRVSEGDLSVRLYSKLKRRHDELSDLGRDFDAMVEQLHILISGREALLHDVSHELRTPLARLQLAIGLAQQNQNNIDSSLERIELETHRLDQLIGEILAFSRSDNNANMNQYFDLQSLISVVVNDANYEAKPQQVSVDLKVEPLADPIIKGNPEQIRRAVENIIRNAIRFSKPEDEVQVVLKERGKYLQISVMDCGPGVEEHKLSSIFEPFVRIQSPQLGKGYGLGLAIARKIVKSHHGSIKARNRETSGLVVSIKLPFWKGDDELQKQAELTEKTY